MGERQWSRRRLLGALGAGLTGAVAGCSLDAPGGGTTDGTDSADPGGSEPLPTPAELDIELAANEQLGQPTSPQAEVYRQLSPSVAAVRVRRPRGTASGTAWVYGDDSLVTNQHVVADAESVSVWFDSAGWQDASVVATDIYSDLAVLDPEDRPENAVPIPLVEREQPVGTAVVAIGNPFGLSGSLSAGIVSGQDRTLPAANGFSIPDAVQTDAAVNPGNSGGPLATLDGEVAGVVNAGGGDNIGFAISAAMVQRVVPSLVRTGSYDHPYMGVRLSGVTPPVVRANGLPISWGVYIDQVVDGGPADGTLQGSTTERTVDGQSVPAGGDVIYQMAGTDIPTQQALSTFLALETSPGDTIDVDVVRDGQRRTVQLTLGARPEP
jgi:serine protease Do